MQNERVVKSNFLMKITSLKKTDEGYKVISSEWVKNRAKDFYESLEEDKKKGITHEIEIVAAAPINFQVNKIYVLANGKRAWVFIDKDTNNE
jgi:hypothetical protein